MLVGIIGYPQEGKEFLALLVPLKRQQWRKDVNQSSLYECVVVADCLAVSGMGAD